MSRWRCIPIIGATILMMAGCSPSKPEMDATYLRVEYLIEPAGIDVPHPRLSWVLHSEHRNKSQRAYRILVASSEQLLAEGIGDMWDAQRASDESINIPYRGVDLTSNHTYYWKVRVWDEDSIPSPWSKPSQWSTALMIQNEWKAQWIGFDSALNDTSFKAKPWANGMTQASDYRPLPTPYLRKVFELDKVPQDARIHITSLGIYELYINGKKVSDDHFTPGWTDYRQRIHYNTYDVQSYLQKGENTIGVILADGWYAGVIAIRGQHYYGDRLRLKAQLELFDASGEHEQVITDETWKASYGPIREGDMQGGETYDARLEMPGWNNNGFDDANWSSVVVDDTTTAPLFAYPSITVQETEEITPISVQRTENGSLIVDMGQNFAGWASIEAEGKEGDEIVMRFAEMLEKDGTIYTRNLRTARCTDTYILKGEGKEIYAPRFTYHGFRYVEVSGYPGELTKDKIKGVVVHSRLPRAGSFNCSNPLINQLYSNQVWSQRSNYFEVPTDCPQRDERLGWTGDAQVFMPTATFNMDIAAFFQKWMVDVEDGQFPDGRFPSAAPRVYKRRASGWADAGIIVPWLYFQAYGDTLTLRKYYASMARYMHYLDSVSDNGVGTMGSYGDWQNVKDETPKQVIATAFYKHCADLMDSISTILGKHEEATRYRSTSAKVKMTFNEHFVMEDGSVEGHTQTGYLLAFAFDLLSAENRAAAESKLLQHISDNDNHLTTGILGTNLLLPVLSDLGHHQLAYEILGETTFPSWGYQVEQGATTIWERWDGFKADSGLHEDSTNSFNHYAFGSVGEWMYSEIGGIKTARPGFKKINIQPAIGGGLTSAKTSYNSIRGPINTSWNIDDDELVIMVHIPANTTATVVLPVSDPAVVEEGERSIASNEDILSIQEHPKGLILTIGSGSYTFEMPFSHAE